MIEDRLRAGIIIVVTCVWAANFCATLLVDGYEPPPEINSIFMGTVGVALATTPAMRRRAQKKRHKEDGDGA